MDKASRRENTEPTILSDFKKKPHFWSTKTNDVSVETDSQKDASLEEKRVAERKKRIMDLLAQLPNESPTLEDLDRGKWWKLIIDKKDHKSAQNAQRYSLHMKEPGKFYDRDKSPGYYQGMIDFFEIELAGKQKSVQKEITYDTYTAYHTLLTKHIPNDKQQSMRELNGTDRKSYDYAIYQPVKLQTLKRSSQAAGM